MTVIYTSLFLIYLIAVLKTVKNFVVDKRKDMLFVGGSLTVYMIQFYIRHFVI